MRTFATFVCLILVPPRVNKSKAQERTNRHTAPINKTLRHWRSCRCMAGTPFLTQQHKLPQPQRPRSQLQRRQQVAPPRLPRLQRLPDAPQVNTETVEATCANAAQLIRSSQQKTTRWIDARLCLLAKMTSTLQVLPQALQTCGAQRAKCAATTSGKPKRMPQGRLNVNARSSPSVLVDSTF